MSTPYEQFFLKKESHMNTRKIFGCGAHYLLSGMLAVIFALALSACGDGSETDDTGKKPVSGVTPTGGTGDTPWTWTAVANSTFSSDYYAITNIAYGNGRFVAVGDEGKMAYSDDGTTWTAVADSTIWESDYGFGTFPITAITYDNNRWVAGGREGKIAYSDDNGVTWTAVANSTIWDYTNSYGDTAAFEIKGIAYGGDKFVAVGGAVMAYADW